MADETAPDPINALMERCQAAWNRCDNQLDVGRGPTGPTEDFSIFYFPGRDQPWRVGFYEYDYGKQTAEGATLAEALTEWLNTYEHWWDTCAGDVVPSEGVEPSLPRT